MKDLEKLSSYSWGASYLWKGEIVRRDQLRASRGQEQELGPGGMSQAQAVWQAGAAKLWRML